jgi:hypothetical protein
MALGETEHLAQRHCVIVTRPVVGKRRSYLERWFTVSLDTLDERLRVGGYTVKRGCTRCFELED